MDTATSIAGLISLADLVLKYSRLIDVWKDAPASLRRINTLLVSLQPIVFRLEQLQELSEEALFRQGMNISAFRADIKELSNLADAMLGTKDKLELWKRTKWTLKANGQATELGDRLKSHIMVFGLVMDLASQ